MDKNIKEITRVKMQCAKNIRKLEDQLEQMGTQLAGCSVIAAGHYDDTKEGDYGYSVAYQDVKELRQKYDKLRKIKVCSNERPLRKTLCQLNKGHGGSCMAVIFWEKRK